MKLLLLCAVLAVVTTGLTGSIVKSPAARSSVYYGYVHTGDRLLNRTYVQKLPIPNTIQSQDVAYRGNVTTRISAIQVVEIGYTQYATPWLLSGARERVVVTMQYVKALCVLLLLLVDAGGNPTRVLEGELAVSREGCDGLETSGAVTEAYFEATTKVLMLPAFEAGVCATGMAKVNKKCVPIAL
ncbi:unnamed protein product, partial [Iphiclides podalirius]